MNDRLYGSAASWTQRPGAWTDARPCPPCTACRFDDYWTCGCYCHESDEHRAWRIRGALQDGVPLRGRGGVAAYFEMTPDEALAFVDRVLGAEVAATASPPAELHRHAD